MTGRLRGGGKRGRGSSAGSSKDVKDLDELNMLMVCPPKVNDDDVPAVKAARSLQVHGSVLAWLETLDVNTLQMMEQEILGRPKTCSLERITSSYVSYSIEMKSLERLGGRIHLAENWARIVFRKSSLKH